jgi:hypothetical protein
MDPLFLQAATDLEDRPAKKKWGAVRALRWGLRSLGWVVGKLFSDPLARKRHGRQDGNDSPFGRFVREATGRLVFGPLLVVLSVAALVYSGTHPPTPPPGPGPASVGLYYESVNFASSDATRLRGWIVPSIDAGRVLDGSEGPPGSGHPGVVLAHDYGQSQSQLLPLLAPLHEAGFEVLAVGLRGVGLGRPAALTFGPDESKDITAAVQVLRARPSVDPRRIAIVGVGTGANAALLSFQRDNAIAALVLADPVPGSREAVHRYIGPNFPALEWMQSLTRWGWEICYHAGADEIDLTRFQTILADERTFRADNVLDTTRELAPRFVRRATEFLTERLCITN